MTIPQRGPMSLVFTQTETIKVRLLTILQLVVVNVEWKEKLYVSDRQNTLELQADYGKTSWLLRFDYREMV